MSTIYIVEPGGQQATYAEERAWMLYNQEGISRKALYWKEGMADWQSISALFDNQLKDATTLTRFLKVMLWLSMGVAALGVLTEAASLIPGNAASTGLDGWRLLAAISALLTLLAFIATSVPFLMWIHRANRNARALGAQDMRFTPGWSVGWFFVPLLSLWKPYQAMKEIWRASQDPHTWQELWLSRGAESSQALVSSTVVGLLADVANVALCVVAVRLVTAIYLKQGEWVHSAAAARAAGSDGE